VYLEAPTIQSNDSPRNLRHSIHLCKLNEYSLFGEAECIQNCPRVNRAVVAYSSAKIIEISFSTIETIIRDRGENIESFKASVYNDYVKMKQNWREGHLK
jgi:hypothetical protein